MEWSPLGWWIKVRNLWVKYEELCAAKCWWKSRNPLPHTNRKSKRSLYYSVGAFANVKYRVWYSCKIKSIPINSARDTLKENRNSMSFKWYVGRSKHRTWIPLNWCRMNLTKKSELNSSQVRLSSDNSCRKTGQNYLQSTFKMPRICEAVIAPKGGHFDE